MRVYIFMTKTAVFLQSLILVVKTSMDYSLEDITNISIRLFYDSNIYMLAFIKKIDDIAEEKTLKYINSVNLSKSKSLLDLFSQGLNNNDIQKKQKGFWGRLSFFESEEEKIPSDTGFKKVFYDSVNILKSLKNDLNRPFNGITIQYSNDTTSESSDNTTTTNNNNNQLPKHDDLNTPSKLIENYCDWRNNNEEKKIENFLESIDLYSDCGADIPDENQNHVIGDTCAEDFKNMVQVYNKMYEFFVSPVMKNIMDIFSLFSILQTNSDYINTDKKTSLIKEFKLYGRSLDQFCVFDKNLLFFIFKRFEKVDSGKIFDNNELISYKKICEEYMMICKVLDDVKNYKSTSSELEEKKNNFLEIFDILQLLDSENAKKTIQRVLTTMNFLDFMGKMRPLNSYKSWESFFGSLQMKDKNWKEKFKEKADLSFELYFENFNELKNFINTISDTDTNAKYKSINEESAECPVVFLHLKSYFFDKCSTLNQLNNEFLKNTPKYMIFFPVGQLTIHEKIENVSNSLFPKLNDFFLENLNLQSSYISDFCYKERETYEDEETLFTRIYNNHFANLQELILNYMDYVENFLMVDFKTGKNITITLQNYECIIEILKAMNDNFFETFNFYLDSLKKEFEKNRKKQLIARTSVNLEGVEPLAYSNISDLFKKFENFSVKFETGFKQIFIKTPDFTPDDNSERYIDRVIDYQKLSKDFFTKERTEFTKICEGIFDNNFLEERKEKRLEIISKLKMSKNNQNIDSSLLEANILINNATENSDEVIRNEKEQLEKEQIKKEQLEKEQLEEVRLEEVRLEKEQLEKKRLEAAKLLVNKLREDELEKQSNYQKSHNDKSKENQIIEKQQKDKDSLEKSKSSANWLLKDELIGGTISTNSGNSSENKEILEDQSNKKYEENLLKQKEEGSGFHEGDKKSVINPNINAQIGHKDQYTGKQVLLSTDIPAEAEKDLLIPNGVDLTAKNEIQKPENYDHRDDNLTGENHSNPINVSLNSERRHSGTMNVQASSLDDSQDKPKEFNDFKYKTVIGSDNKDETRSSSQNEVHDFQDNSSVIGGDGSIDGGDGSGNGSIDDGVQSQDSIDKSDAKENKPPKLRVIIITVSIFCFAGFTFIIIFIIYKNVTSVKKDS